MYAIVYVCFAAPKWFRRAHLVGEVEGVGHGDGERDAVAEEEAGLVGQLQHVLRGEHKAVAVKGIVVPEFDHVGPRLRGCESMPCLVHSRDGRDIPLWQR